MKIYINFLKFLFILLFLSLLFITSCDILSTYSEDEYLALGEKDKDTGYIGSSEIQVIVEDSDYILNNKELFNFDDIPIIPINKRTSEIIFRIYNNGTKPLELTGNPKIIIDNVSDFTINQNTTSSTISPDDWTTFSITFTSSSTDGIYKLANISIPNNSNNNNPFIFTVGCSAKASGIVEFTNVGTTEWSCPAIDASLNIILVGGGGGGGDSGLDNGYPRGGGGGGAGQKIDLFNLKDQNYTFSILIGNGGGRGGDGQPSSIHYGSNQVIANFGSGGEGGAHGGDGGAGYPQGGNSDNCPEDQYGAAGGNNGRGCGGQAQSGERGIDADPTTGGGGGGGAYQRNGSYGGSGYCSIEWTGFLIP